MKTLRLLITISLLITLGGGAIDAQDRGLSFSGTLDTRILMGAGAGEGPDFSLGLETAANMRFQAPLREWGTFYGAFNLIAATGSIAAAAGQMAGANNGPFLSTPLVAGENYAGGIELERLYFRIQGEYTQLDTGLMRLPFGYGTLWGPSDFLNPRSPLLPDARLRGIMGSAFSAFPGNDLKLQAFAAAPKNPLASGGEGFILGLSGENHWSRASVQALYAYETPGAAPQGANPQGASPQEESSYGVHRAGLSVKADVEVGLVADALYTYNPSVSTGIEGLAASAGVDYSLLDGSLYVLTEYLYSGAASSTARNLGLANRHYLNAMGRYRINDYAGVSLVVVAGLEDYSFSPILSAEYEPFQGMTLGLSAQIPLDRDLFSGNGETGELGPENSRNYAVVTLKARLRF
ncbi:MAG: hypothetical protein LBG76_07340 [Treponema sp.]|jgi:hypothetical protein|nr:hypothetical protein [Treponema sp.]